MRDPDELLTGQEYARERKCSLRTIERERTSGSGCRFIKIGRSVRYRWRDVLAFVEQHLRQNTSQVERLAFKQVALEFVECGVQEASPPLPAAGPSPRRRKGVATFEARGRGSLVGSAEADLDRDCHSGDRR
jgi:hypothetical protein